MHTKDLCTCAIEIAISKDIESEKKIKERLLKDGVRATGVNFGGNFVSSIPKMIERIMIASKKEGILISEEEAGAIIGATKDALSQITVKATGFDVGGKISIAREKNQVAVVAYFCIGTLNLNDMVLGLGHRVM